MYTSQCICMYVQCVVWDLLQVHCCEQLMRGGVMSNSTTAGVQ